MAEQIWMVGQGAKSSVLHMLETIFIFEVWGDLGMHLQDVLATCAPISSLAHVMATKLGCASVKEPLYTWDVCA